jgi:DNA end-binding protein Ku
MARPIWKGAISFGLVTIPVSLVTAEESKADIDFHMIDKKTMARVRQKRVNAVTEDEVPWDDIVKGYEYESGKYVVLEPEEIEAANPKATHTIDIVAAVPREAIAPTYFDKPYYIVPDQQGRKAYALLREVLERHDRVAVARVVLRTKQYLAALMPEGEALVLDVLRYAYELRSTESLDLPSEDLAEVGVTDKELELAEQLVGSLAEEWEPEQYENTFRTDMLDLIKRKIEEGGATITEMPDKPAAPTAQVVDIMDLLKQSVEQAAKKRA